MEKNLFYETILFVLQKEKTILCTTGFFLWKRKTKRSISKDIYDSIYKKRLQIRDIDRANRHRMCASEILLVFENMHIIRTVRTYWISPRRDLLRNITGENAQRTHEEVIHETLVNVVENSAPQWIERTRAQTNVQL